MGLCYLHQKKSCQSTLVYLIYGERYQRCTPTTACPLPKTYIGTGSPLSFDSSWENVSKCNGNVRLRNWFGILPKLYRLRRIEVGTGKDQYVWDAEQKEKDHQNLPCAFVVKKPISALLKLVGDILWFFVSLKPGLVLCMVSPWLILQRFCC